MTSPYLIGIGIGVLSWFSFLLSNKAIGASTAYARTSGMIEKIFNKKTEKKLYYKKYAPVIDWQWMLVFGIIIGAFISARLSGEFGLVWVPALWESTFGSTVLNRLLVALIGGIILGFGARWANGCTSGHGISGTMQLAVSSWLAAISFFIGGIITTMIIFNLI